MSMTIREDIQLELALAQLKSEIVSGLKHGFFELKVIGEKVNQHGKRRLVIKSGKSHIFHISLGDMAE
jgi:hypothetical protein